MDNQSYRSAASERKRKVLLVFPGSPVTRMQRKILVNLPLSVLQLAGYLLERQYGVVIYDMRVQPYADIAQEIADCLAVGLSCMTGVQIKSALECAAQIRQTHPAIPLIWGGIHPTLYPLQTLEHPLVDLVVKSEGEATLYDVLEALFKEESDFSNIAGLCFKRHDALIENPDRPFLDLETLPLPAYHLVALDRYPNIVNGFNYQSSRGCPFRCAFCYNVAFSKRRYRMKSAEKTASELEWLVKTYHVKKVVFHDDEFFINQTRVERICDLLLAKDLQIVWQASCRLDVIRKYPESVLHKIKASGCHSLNFGAESGSPDMLKRIAKDITTDDILEGAKHTVQNGIIPLMSFMGGFPHETMQDTLQTKAIITQLWAIDHRIVPNGVFIYNPYPGNALFHESIQAGVKLPQNLAEWGNWIFKYDGDLPWLSKPHRRMLRVIFLIVRSKFYIHEMMSRLGYTKVFRYTVKLLMSPYRISAALRWRYNWFRCPIEWDILAFLMQKIFGFL